MKRTYAFIICFVMSILSLLAQEPTNNAINISLPNDSTDTFLLKDVERIKHGTDGSIALIITGDTITYAASDVLSIYFSYMDFPNIIVTTGEASGITESSAIVECSFGELPNGASCGVRYSCNGEEYEITEGDVSGLTQLILLIGLEPLTTYTYYAYVEYAGETYCGEIKSFTTNPPDISGTWTCTQKNYNHITHSYSTETYTITLNSDGTVNSSKYEDVVSSSWHYNTDGELSINITDVATMTYSHGVEWGFSADNPKNPKIFTGSTYSWNYSGSGNHQSDGYECTLTR